NAGADKVGINTAAVERPELIREAALRFGRQCVVVAIDARRTSADRWEVYIRGGRTPAGRDAVAWAREAAERGAGELLVTSMDQDGHEDGYDLALIRAITRAGGVPGGAAGGAGRPRRVGEGRQQAGAGAAA